MKACPRCRSISGSRMKRKSFAKLIPGAKSYGCDNCNTTYTWFPLIDLSIRN